jgi:hypothetical protein
MTSDNYSFREKQKLEIFEDTRGKLNVLEFSHLEKQVQRIFWITNVPKNETRANHGHYKGTQVIICMNESVKIARERADGSKDTLVLELDEMVTIDPMTWISISFSSNLATVLILADSKYDKSDVFTSLDEIV